MKKKLLFSILMFAAVLVSAQESSKQTYTRNLLLEQFTTVNCGYCPAGAERIAEAISNATSLNVIWIKHHAGFGTDFLTNNIHTSLLPFYGESTFAPAMMLDRTRFDDEFEGPVCSVGLTGSIRLMFNKAKRVTTYCQVNPVEASLKQPSNKVEGVVSGCFGEDDRWDEKTRIVVYLIEDSIVGEQHDYSSHGNWTNYLHMGTVRDVLTELWGNELEVDPTNRTFSCSFSKALPNGCNYRHCWLVAFVYQYDASDINNCPVLNANKSDYLTETVGIAEIDGGCSLRLYPNPAVERVVIESDEAIDEVWITDVFGRKVFSAEGTEQGASQLTLNTNNFPTGIYLVSIRTASGTSTRKLNVCK